MHAPSYTHDMKVFWTRKVSLNDEKGEKYFGLVRHNFLKNLPIKEGSFQESILQKIKREGGHKFLLTFDDIIILSLVNGPAYLLKEKSESISPFFILPWPDE